MSPLCEEHLAYKNHQPNSCLAEHKHVPGQEPEAQDTKEAPETGNLAGTVPFVDQAKEEDQKSGNRNVEQERSAKFEIKVFQIPW
jgi:hypothetical protein